jgi:hypothetical protein
MRNPMAPVNTKTFYRAILEFCEAAGSGGALSEEIRTYAERKLGEFLSPDELERLRNPKPRAKGNYFAWALADLVRYKFLSGPPRYALTETGKQLADYVRKNPSAEIDRRFLRRF